MLLRTGVPTEDDLRSALPHMAEKKSRVAVIECFQEIPCDPCFHACPTGAIEPFVDINNRPRLVAEKCTGCAVCVSHCPGLAIFVVNEGYSTNEDLVMIPYEFYPVPKTGDVVLGLDRTGEPLCNARVLKITNRPSQDRTLVISLAVPKGLGQTVRGLRIPVTVTGGEARLSGVTNSVDQ